MSRGEREPPVDPYFQEVANIPLLTPEEEKELLDRFSQGKGAKTRLEKLGNDGLNPEEREELESVIFLAKEARDKLVEANQRLVISIAKKHRGRGVGFKDLIQEGTIGLIKAIDRFDNKRINPQTGEPSRLSTYATWWIRQTVGRAVADQGRTIRIPIHKVELLGKIGKAKQSLTAEFSREPTIEEIARKLGEKQETIERTLRQDILLSPLSLDEKIGEEEETARGEMIEDKEALLPSKESERTVLSEDLQRRLENLTPREREVIELRFGLGNGNSRTLEEVGREIGVTRERVRQIEADALRKLRHPSRARRLRDYLEKG